ncbi:MAG: rRNA pseudouridine synthase [Firmicutes bacterium]|nr:rRNA pseudouridine synthase [Bacillota bacterium]
MRINKYLAQCGVASRRACEQLVLDGRVKKGGRVISDLATDIKEDDIITVDGVKVELTRTHTYLMLNKPKGYVCTTSDEKGRKTVIDLIKGDEYADKRIFPVGRLDYDTEGLLLLTTDGDAANRLTHPSYEISKTYVAKIEGEIEESELAKIRAGIMLDGVKTKRCKARQLDLEEHNGKKISRIEIVISEGRNRQVRRMFEGINREVIFLKRIAIGNIRLGGLSRGSYRELRPQELKELR